MSAGYFLLFGGCHAQIPAVLGTHPQKAFRLSESMCPFRMKKWYHLCINQNRNSPFFRDLQHMVSA